ncbi:MAG: WbqC family protein [Acidimicrobiales bacterium]
MTTGSRRVVMTQSNYIPWRGFFDMIDRADVVVLYDDAQYTRRDWRNRNKIKTATGPKWLTIPVKVKGRYEQRIYDTEVADRWTTSHWSSIEQAYREAPCFAGERDFVADLYRQAAEFDHLSQVNRFFLESLCGRLTIDTPFLDSSSFELSGTSTEKLLNVCVELGATSYLSGPAAKDYLDVEAFSARGIEVEWMSFDYPDYPQLHGEFIGPVSVIDLLLHTGSAALDHIRPPIPSVTP